MIDSLDNQAIDYHLSNLNEDSVFDVKVFIEFIENNTMGPNIKQNIRNNKKKDILLMAHERHELTTNTPK